MSKKEIATRKPTQSERFALMVEQQFKGQVSLEITPKHKKAIQNYFLALDRGMKVLDSKRKHGAPPIEWANLNMPQLAQDVVTYSAMNLNPLLPNHINMIPFLNKRSGQYDVGFVEGYVGKEIIAKDFGLEAPDWAVVELVHANDEFQILKKDHKNPVESYIFEIPDPFDRGDIIGGFYYHVYDAEPVRNKVVAVSIKDIEKRKPKYASVEFWGGEKDVWKYDPEQGKNVRTGEKEQVDGWHERMCEKTLKRMCWGDVVLDATKLDSKYMDSKDEASMRLTDEKIDQVIQEKANKEPLSMGGADEPQRDAAQPEPYSARVPEPEAMQPTPQPEEEPQQQAELDLEAKPEKKF